MTANYQPHWLQVGATWLIAMVGVYFAATQRVLAINEEAAPNEPAQEATATVVIPFGVMTSREFLLSAMILVFGLLVVGVEYLLLKPQPMQTAEGITRPITVTLIIIGTLVLISSGFNNNQIAPAVGLFGTIAGYLLGRTQLRQSQDGSDVTKESKHE